MIQCTWRFSYFFLLNIPLATISANFPATTVINGNSDHTFGRQKIRSKKKNLDPPPSHNRLLISTFSLIILYVPDNIDSRFMKKDPCKVFYNKYPSSKLRKGLIFQVLTAFTRKPKQLAPAGWPDS